MNGTSNDRYDVAILGAGFEGGLLGTILACNGASVVIIDPKVHPRFTVGESTVRHTFRMIKIMAERFQVPELLEKFYSGAHVHKHITSSCGEKRNFGFLYHREGQHQNPEEANQLVIPPFREGYEAHLFRQDIDSFLTSSAIHHGATVHYNTTVTDVEIDKKGVMLKGSNGETFKARYVCDGSGQSSILGRLLGLREDPTPLKTNTRALFTHMIDVTPYDELNLPTGIPKMPEPWYAGTCHHIFDGGWVWVIPFNNREGSTNPLVSVGLSFDNERFPKPEDMTPQEEWESFLSRFPSIGEQFKNAKVVRDWISSKRLQYSHKQAVGDRYCLLAAAHGSGFIDAIFSRGMANSAEVINALAARLLPALKDDDFSAERFEYLQRMQDHNLAYNDKLAHGSYISWRDYDLWNAWFRVWALGVGLGDLRLAATFRLFKKTRDESVLPDNQEPSLFFGNIPEYRTLFDQASAEMEAVDEGKTSAKDAAKHIIKLLEDVDYTPPANRLADPNRKYINQGHTLTLLRTMAWVLFQAPPAIRQMSLGTVSDLNPGRLFRRGKDREAAASET